MKKIRLLLAGLAVWTATSAVAVALADTAPTTPATPAAAHQPKAGDLPKPSGEPKKASKRKATQQNAADSTQPAKKQQPISIKFDVRADWEYHHYGEDGPDDESGFAGKFLNFILDGNINDQFSYHFRYRFNKLNSAQDFFEATDWAYLNYDINKNWRLSAGKQVIAIGGYEYDKAPIDVYFYSDFCNYLPACYEFGISGQYTTDDGRNTILFQISNSPFTSKSIRFEGLYAYNLMWYGNYGVFNSMYSVNLIEYKPNRYINYIALGNQFNAGPVCIELDYTNRYGGGKNFFNDFTVVGKVNYSIHNRVNIFVKGGFDYNNAQSPTVIPPDIASEDYLKYLQSLYYYDLAVLPGTHYGFYGAGVEFFPMKNSHNVRLHAYWCSSTANTKAHNVGIGFRWRLNAFERE
ncbi:MAG: OprO/OprP family phosphate-selective porin [Bacteroidales bacterium]|nr:OprO/OprP family phosphate-selective porin [Bacteroidales bacterium]